MSQTKITIGHVPVNRGAWGSNRRYYKDNIVQYLGGSYIANPPGYSVDNPDAYISSKPYESVPSQLNTGWSIFADGEQNNSVHVNDAQQLSDAQKAQALANVGISGIDSEPVAGSSNLVESGGVKNEIDRLEDSLVALSEDYIIPNYTTIPGAISIQGDFMTSQSYSYTSSIELKKGNTITVITKGNANAVISIYGNFPVTPLVIASGSLDPEVYHTYEYTANSDMFVICCIKSEFKFQIYTTPGKVSNIAKDVVDAWIGGDISEKKLINGWINDKVIPASNAVIGEPFVPYSSPKTGYCYVRITDVLPQKRYIINGAASGGIRLWYFLDANNILLDMAAPFASATNNELVLTPPQNAVELIINSNIGENCYEYTNSGYMDRLREKQIITEVDSLSCGELPVEYEYTPRLGYIDMSGNIVGSGTYSYTKIALKNTYTVFIETAGWGMCAIAKTDIDGTSPFIPIAYIVTGSVSDVQRVSHKNTSGNTEYIILCWRIDPTPHIWLEPSFESDIPEYILLPTTSYVSTARNYILKNEELEGVDTLLYSKDCGRTWVSLPNTIGDIVFVHWFLDGTCLIAGNHKIYTTKDFVNLVESTVLDENGEVFVPEYNAFFRLGNYDSPYYELEGKEVLIWNDYGIRQGYVSRIWYTEDNGRTIKCICAQGITKDTDDNVITVRHFHRTFVDGQHLWITSGDSGSECKLIRATLSGGLWEFTVVGYGDRYKLGQFWINGKYAYAVTDYTEGLLPTGIIRCPINHLDEPDYFEYVTKIEGNPPLSSYYEDASGYKIILPDGSGTRRLYIANKNFSFKKVNIAISDSVAPMILIGPNYNGECIVNGISGYLSEQPLKLNYKRYALSKGFIDTGINNIITASQIL